MMRRILKEKQKDRDLAEELETAAAEAEVLNDVVDLLRLAERAVVRLLADHNVSVDVGVDDVSVDVAANTEKGIR